MRFLSHSLFIRLIPPYQLKDESLEDTENLPEPDELAGEIVAKLAAALEQFQDISE